MSVFIPAAAAERAYRNSDPDETGCHISRYAILSNNKGSRYAQIGWSETNEHGRGTTTAHRAAWVHVHGQIPEGMTIDHTCKNGQCVNVDHLRMLSNFDNARRTSGRDWPLGQCIKGHSDSELVTNSRGRQECRICRKEWNRRYNAKRRAS